MVNSLSLGEIVSWSSPSGVSVAKLREAIAKAGLSQTLIRKMLPRNAFARAARKLAENRVIIKTGEEGGTLYFQLTRTMVDHGEHGVDFWKEAVLALVKSSGELSCESAPHLSAEEQAKLVEHVRQLMDAEVESRTGADVTMLVQLIFKKHAADLVSIREAGGAYFVPQSQIDVILRVQELLSTIGGSLRRFSIGEATAETSRSIADSMADHFNRLISEFRDSCEIVSPDSSVAVLKRRRQRIQELRFKLSTFRDMLSDQAGELNEALTDAERELNSRREGTTPPLGFTGAEEPEQPVETAKVSNLAF